MDVLMPQLGETVAEGTITNWFKAVGDKVEPGENLFEIETDKATMEVPATTAGKLAEIRVPVGTIAPVGAVVAVCRDRNEPRVGGSAAWPGRGGVVEVPVVGQVGEQVGDAALVEQGQPVEDCQGGFVAGGAGPDLPVGDVLEGLGFIRPAGVPPVGYFPLAPAVGQAEGDPGVDLVAAPEVLGDVDPGLTLAA